MPRWVGWDAPDGVAPCVHEGVFLVSAGGGSGPWGVSHAPHEGAAEGTEDFVYKGRVSRLGLRLRTDQLSSRFNQTPDSALRSYPGLGFAYFTAFCYSEGGVYAHMS